MNTDLISIIVPVYNVEEYIEECIQSLIHQTYSNLEIILIDDGSIDSSGKICDMYAELDSRIRVIHQANQGVVTAVNTGISVAAGAYMAFVDADDWIELNMYETLLSGMEDYDLISSGLKKENVNFNETIPEHASLPEGVYSGKEAMEFVWSKMIIDRSIYKSGISHCRFVHLFRSSIVKQIYLMVDKNLVFCEDTVFVCSYLLHAKSIKIIKKAYYHYRMRENSCVHSVHKQYLTHINNYYLCMESILSRHYFSPVLLEQLEFHVTYMVCNGMCERMGFRFYHKIKYRFPFEKKLVEDKRIVLYGAGNVGRDYFQQLQEIRTEECLWVDRNYDQMNNPFIKNIEEIFQNKFEMIIIAVQNEGIACDIGKNLMKRGINKEIILWNPPLQEKWF